MATERPHGFDFDLCNRNAWLEKQGLKQLKPWSTGTTIAGVVFKDGVVLGADTRSTAGETVADKNCEKIHYIAPNIYCCGAGTAADTENVTGMISSQLELHKFRTGRESRVVTALTLLKSHLFRYQGYVSAALVLGGFDCKGPHLFTVFPHGSTDSLPFCTMGSGSLNAMAVYEQSYKEDMTKEEAMELTKRAIRAGIFNDLGSGSNVDLCVITAGKSAACPPCSGWRVRVFSAGPPAASPLSPFLDLLSLTFQLRESWPSDGWKKANSLVSFILLLLLLLQTGWSTCGTWTCRTRGPSRRFPRPSRWAARLC